MLAEAAHYLRMAAGTAEYLRAPKPADPLDRLRAQMARREERFLSTVRQTVFERPGNPYRELFRWAGCAFADLEAAVTRDGLDAALKQLESQGVWLSHDEFKGKKPIRRAGLEIAPQPGSFVNPLYSARMVSSSSGSSGRIVITPQNREFQLHKEGYMKLVFHGLGIAGRGFVETKPILPNNSGFASVLRRARLGEHTEKWFAVRDNLSKSAHYRFVTGFLVALSRTLGARLPFPSYLPDNDFLPIARWLARRCAQGTPCAVSATGSSAVRICGAAVEHGLDIAGTVFTVGGEALTDAKRASIEAAGAEVYTTYHISELGHVGSSCRAMRDGNRVHLHSDAVAVIASRRIAPLSEREVDSLLFTTLLPYAPHILINVEMQDCGTLETLNCDCPQTRLGFTTGVSGIFSYGKLTGQGVTLLGTDALRILEAALPARFGGGPGDYQLVEQEVGGQTQLILRVHPRLGVGDTSAVRAFFLQELRRYVGGGPAVSMLRHSEGIEVAVARPEATRSGKVHPIRVLGERKDSHGS